MLYSLPVRPTNCHAPWYYAWLIGPMMFVCVLAAACGGGESDEGENNVPALLTTPTSIPTATPFAVAPAPTIVAVIGAEPTPHIEEIYLVEAGDTLSGIAERFDTTVEAVMAANELTNPTLIFVGQELTIPRNSETAANPTPAPGGNAVTTPTPKPDGERDGDEVRVTSYVVKSGDTALAIAIEFGVTLTALAEANNTTEGELSFINVGDELILPPPR